MSSTTCSGPSCDRASVVASLRALRMADGRTIRRLSADTGIPASTLGGFFSGRHMPVDRETWRRLMTALGVSETAVDDWVAAAAVKRG